MADAGNVGDAQPHGSEEERVASAFGRYKRKSTRSRGYNRGGVRRY